MDIYITLEKRLTEKMLDKCKVSRHTVLLEGCYGGGWDRKTLMATICGPCLRSYLLDMEERNRRVFIGSSRILVHIFYDISLGLEPELIV